MDLLEARRQIDAIDDQILSLFVRRMAVAREIGALKAEKRRAVRDEAREAELLARIEHAAPPELKARARELFTLLLALSREQQEEMP